jgi:hypothetical protein
VITFLPNRQQNKKMEKVFHTMLENYFVPDELGLSFSSINATTIQIVLKS